MIEPWMKPAGLIPSSKSRSRDGMASQRLLANVRPAESFGKRTGLDVVRVCPVILWGPMLQSTLNASSLLVIRLLKEENESTDIRPMKIVDVQDATESLLLALDYLAEYYRGTGAAD